MNVPSPLAGEGYTSASNKRDGVRGWCGNPEFAMRREPLTRASVWRAVVMPSPARGEGTIMRTVPT